MDMVNGMLHRAGVAIVLIAALLLPLGTCRSLSPAAAHDCCVHHPVRLASVKASCCTVRSQLPAVATETTALSAAPASITASLDMFAQLATPFEPAAPTLLPRHFPPPGKSILRI